jgi:membrane fusion protein (multidrug efflux system)
MMNPLASPLGRRFTRFAIIALVLCLLIAVAYWLHRQFTVVQSNDARIAADMITVSSELPGRITQFNLTPGQRVAAGDLLVQFDDSEGKAAVAESRAALNQLEANRATLAARIDQQRNAFQADAEAAQSRLESAGASLAATRAREELARHNAERADALVTDHVISVQSWDQSKHERMAAEQAAREAAAQLKVAQAGVAQARANAQNIDVLERQLTEVDAAIEQARATLAQREIRLAKLSLRSTLDGVVDEIFTHAGEYAVPGRRLLLMHDPATIRVEANVKETDIEDVKLGSRVTIRVDAYSDLQVTGRVSDLGQAATSQFALIPNPNPSGNFTKITQRLPIRIALDQPSADLRPGMMVEVAIEH